MTASCNSDGENSSLVKKETSLDFHLVDIYVIYRLPAAL